MTADFSTISIPAPTGEPARPALPYRFVLLEHDWPAPHFDLMIEDGRPDLRSWALEKAPGRDPTTAYELPRHRPDYLDYEGPVSGGRGTVRRLDTGRCAPVHTSLECLVLWLRGAAVRGLLRLVRTDVQAVRGRIWLATLHSGRDSSTTASPGDSPR